MEDERRQPTRTSSLPNTYTSRIAHLNRLTMTRSIPYLRGESTPRRTRTLDSDVYARHTFPKVGRRRRLPRAEPPEPASLPRLPRPEYSEALRVLCRKGKDNRLPYNYDMRHELRCRKCASIGMLALRLSYMKGQAGQHYYVVSTCPFGLVRQRLAAHCNLSARSQDAAKYTGQLSLSSTKHSSGRSRHNALVTSDGTCRSSPTSRTPIARCAYLRSCLRSQLISVLSGWNAHLGPLDVPWSRRPPRGCLGGTSQMVLRTISWA